MGNLQTSECRKRREIRDTYLPAIQDFDILEKNDGAKLKIEKNQEIRSNHQKGKDNISSKNCFDVRNNSSNLESSSVPLEEHVILESPKNNEINLKDRSHNNGQIQSLNTNLNDQSKLLDSLQTKCTSILGKEDEQSSPMTQISSGSCMSERLCDVDNRISLFSNKSDYELNFATKTEDKLRRSYLTKLVNNNIWTKNEAKIHNSLIIFDWDDTLMCTSYLTPSGVFCDDTDEECIRTRQKLEALDDAVCVLLTKAISLGDTLIITNSEPGWVEFSAKRFYPKTEKILSNIKIVSARGKYEEKFPGDNREWKVQTFLEILKVIDINLITNIICLGDSTIEIEAAHILASKFPNSYIKTVKFKESPKPSELKKQLRTVTEQFDKIYTSIKNLTIRVEKKSRV